MGDRANVKLVQRTWAGEERPIYLYTHWRGSELAETLRAALRRGDGRWDDDSYLARIIWGEMTRDDPLGTTGFGIGVERPDNEHRIIAVDCQKGTITIESEDGRPYVTFSTFAEYVGCSPEALAAAYDPPDNAWS